LRPSQLKYYKDREIDRVIWNHLRAWFAGDENMWLRLDSGLGRGNTALLRNVEGKLNSEFGTQVEVLLAAPWNLVSQSELLPPGPIAQTLYRVGIESPGGWPRRVVSSLLNSHWGSRLLFLIVLAFSIVVFVGAVLAQGRLAAVTRLGLAGVGLVALALFVLNRLDEVIRKIWSRILAGPQPPRLDREALNRYRDEEFICRELLVRWRDTKRVVLLIDEAHTLGASELTLLNKLLTGRLHSEYIRPLWEQHQFLFLTIQLSEPVERPNGNVKFERIEPFSASEIDEIGQVYGAPASAIAESIASGNIKLLFEDSYSQLLERVRSEMHAALVETAPSRWGLPHLLCCIASSLYSAFSESELLGLFSPQSSALAQQLEERNLSALSVSVHSLLPALEKIQLLHRDGRSYYRDTRVAKAVVEIAAEIDAATLKDAHLFWYRNAWAVAERHQQAPGAPRLNSPMRKEGLILGGAYHLVSADCGSMTIDPVPPSDQIAILSAAVRAACTIGSLDLALQYRDASIRVLERHSGNALTTDTLNEFSEAYWRFYWLFGRDLTDRTVLYPGDNCPTLGNLPIWRINKARYVYLMNGEVEASVAEVEIPAGWVDFAHRTEMLLRARMEDGLLFDARNRKSFRLPAPTWDATLLGEEHRLASAAARAAMRRGQEEGLLALLRSWREHLLHPAEGAGVTQAALGDLFRGLYNAALLGYWRRHTNIRKHTADSIRETISQLGLDQDSGERDPQLFLEMSVAYLEDALQMSLLLGMIPLAMEANLELGFLFAWYRTNEHNVRSPSWWKEWGDFLDAALRHEAILRWTATRPEVLRFRYDYFQRFDRSAASTYGLPLYRAMESAAFPRAVLLRWNLELRNLLTGTSASGYTHLACAELWEYYFNLRESEWKTNPADRAVQLDMLHALTLSSQEFRFGDDRPRAANSLAQATALCFALWGSDLPGPEVTIAERRERTIFLAYISQRLALLGSDIEGRQSHTQLLRNAWAWCEPSDQHLTWYFREVLSSDDLAFPTLTDPFSDPINPQLSIGPSSAAPQNSQEFRVRQLLTILAGNGYLDLNKIADAVRSRWEAYSFPELAVLQLAYSVQRSKLRPEIVEVLACLLKAAYSGLLEKGHDEKRRKDIVNQLRYWDPTNRQWDEEHSRICIELEEIVATQIAEEKRSGQSGWSEMVTNLLGHLDRVNWSIINERHASELRRRNQSEAEYRAYEQQRDAALQQSMGEYESGNLPLAYSILEQFVPGDDQEYVDIGDLKVLEAQIRCADHSPELEPFLASLESRLHRLALRYVEMFAGTISDAAEHHLALNLIRIVREAMEPTPQESDPSELKPRLIAGAS
jgi:hypothetical protein